MDAQLNSIEPSMTIFYDSAKADAWLFFSLINNPCIVTFVPSWYINTNNHIHGYKQECILGLEFPCSPKQSSIEYINHVIGIINNRISKHS